MGPMFAFLLKVYTLAVFTVPLNSLHTDGMTPQAPNKTINIGCLVNLGPNVSIY